MAMLIVRLAKSSALEVVLVYGVRRSLFEGWAHGFEGLRIWEATGPVSLLHCVWSDVLCV